MALFITQCPHCNTSFRTRISQLQSADGMVRCGACLKIFAADDNLVPSPDLQTVTIEPTVTTTNSESELTFEDNFADAYKTDESPEFDDEIITLDLADSLPNRITPSISEHQPIWELLEEAHKHHEESKPEAEYVATAINNPTTIPPKPILNDIRDSSSPSDFSAEDLTAIHDFAEPLELDWHKPPRQISRKIGMWAVAVVLSMGLAAQFVWYQHDSLSQNIAFRPFLERACNLFICTLPPIVDIRAINSANLLVRSHTGIANALSVNLIVRNDAAFPQPFPFLNLSFTTAASEVVAARQFTPEEYLTQDVATLAMMPSGAPIQVTMDILDPGSRAINYEVSFSPMFPPPAR